MIKRIFSIGLLTFALSATVVSCKSDDNVFSESPFEREKAQKEELKNVLTSSEKGWKFTYFTDDSGLGAFTFLMKFDENGKVTMVSDFDDESYTPDVSEYEIQLRATTSLVFATGSWIHKLSDPTNSALRAARGFEGEFQFRYYGFTDNSILFRGTKDFKQELEFVKATQEDWDNFNDRRTSINEISDESAPVFRSIEIIKGGDTKKYDATFSSFARFLTFNEDLNQDLLPGISGIGIGFTNDGIIVSPSIKVEGEEFSTFKFNATTQEFVSVNSSDTKVVIKNVTYPTVWGDEYKQMMFQGESAFGFIKEYLLGSPSNSEKAVKLLSAASIDRVQFQFNRGSGQIIYVTNRGNFFYSFRVTDTGISGKMSNGSWSNSNSVPNDIKELHSELFAYGELLLKEQKYNYGGPPNKIITVYCGGIAFDGYYFDN